MCSDANTWRESRSAVVLSRVGMYTAFKEMLRRAVRLNNAHNNVWVVGWDLTLLMAYRMDWLSVHTTRLESMYFFWLR